MRSIHIGLGRLLFVSMLTLPVITSAQANKYGALAVDENKGFHFGFAHDHDSFTAAENAALGFCKQHGGKDCNVVLSWGGDGCGAYQSVTGGNTGHAYGWGVAPTRTAAEGIASSELRKRSNGQPADNQAWACNAKGSGAFTVLKENAPKAGDKLSFTDLNGDEYEYTGPLANGKPHGRGQARFTNGQTYNGDWVDGNAHGRGIWTWPSGARYEGDFVGHRLQGQGTYLFRTHEKYVGEFHNDKLNGFGRKYSPTGKLLYEGQWRNNQKAN